jgi:hypothetical protein
MWWSACVLVFGFVVGYTPEQDAFLVSICKVVLPFVIGVVFADIARDCDSRKNPVIKDDSDWYQPGIDALKKLGKRPHKSAHGFFIWSRGDVQVYELPLDWFELTFRGVTGDNHTGERAVYCNDEEEAMQEAAIAFMRLPESRQKELMK